MGSHGHHLSGRGVLTMAEIVNLRIARKARARQNAEREAAENRAKFGLTKAEKQRQSADGERTDRLLDGAKREDGE